MSVKSIILGICAAALALAVYGVWFRGAPVDLDTPVAVQDGYVRVTAMSGAGFMVIVNQSGQADRLIGIESDAAGMAELHTHTMDANGVMMMRPVDGGLVLQHGQEAVLRRGGDHVMLMGLSAQLKNGDSVMMRFRFENAGVVEVVLPVDNKR